jgi:hypothetical protein
MRTDRRTDRQTDMTKLLVAFRDFGKAPKKRKYNLVRFGRNTILSEDEASFVHLTYLETDAVWITK